MQWIVIGDGHEVIADQLKELERRYPDKLRYRPFSNALEHQLTRYGDFFVNGAWFEPSGLNQFFALKNGTVPVVSAVGGLLDSVKHGINGLLFAVVPGANDAPYDREATARSATGAFEQALALFRDPARLKAVRVQGMKEDHSWSSRIRKEFRSMFEFVLSGGSDLLPFFGQFRQLRGASPSELNAARASVAIPRAGGRACHDIFK